MMHWTFSPVWSRSWRNKKEPQIAPKLKENYFFRITREAVDGETFVAAAAMN